MPTFILLIELTKIQYHVKFSSSVILL